MIKVVIDRLLSPRFSGLIPLTKTCADVQSLSTPGLEVVEDSTLKDTLGPDRAFSLHMPPFPTHIRVYILIHVYECLCVYVHTRGG